MRWHAVLLVKHISGSLGGRLVEERSGDRNHLEKTTCRPHVKERQNERGSSPVNAEKRPDISNNSALLIREAIMTAYSLTGNLSSATELCGELADGELPQDVQAMAVLTKLHNIAMRRPKH